MFLAGKKRYLDNDEEPTKEDPRWIIFYQDSAMALFTVLYDIHYNLDIRRSPVIYPGYF